MLRSLFNEPWLYLYSTVSIRRNYSHKRGGFFFFLLKAKLYKGEKFFY